MPLLILFCVKFYSLYGISGRLGMTSFFIRKLGPLCRYTICSSPYEHPHPSNPASGFNHLRRRSSTTIHNWPPRYATVHCRGSGTWSTTSSLSTHTTVYLHGTSLRPIKGPILSNSRYTSTNATGTQNQQVHSNSIGPAPRPQVLCRCIHSTGPTKLAPKNGGAWYFHLVFAGTLRQGDVHQS
jgi:hypothetical protein